MIGHLRRSWLSTSCLPRAKPPGPLCDRGPGMHDHGQGIPKQQDERHELPAARLRFRVVARCETANKAGTSHTSRVQCYLWPGVIAARSPGGGQDPDAGGLGTFLSQHKHRATQLFSGQVGHKFTLTDPRKSRSGPRAASARCGFRPRQARCYLNPEIPSPGLESPGQRPRLSRPLCKAE